MHLQSNYFMRYEIENIMKVIDGRVVSVCSLQSLLEVNAYIPIAYTVLF
jgi:hypothetical protein